MSNIAEEVEALDDLVEMYSGEMVDNNLRIYAMQKELGDLKNRNNVLAEKISSTMHRIEELRGEA
ncbi:MAG: hypothetical protein J6Y02_08110 [Pseudobutyrivibrio sp.]|nr:hypothetical protein [Pseudobutyrivibrio sp.]